MKVAAALITLVMLLSIVALTPVRSTRAQERPAGVPAGATEAVVTGYEDGDKFKVKIGNKTETVLLISADAPEKGECFASQSGKQLKKYLPKDSTVYLEQDGEDRDGKDRLLRYVWVPKAEGKATFVDERMVANGLSTFKSSDGHTQYDKRMAKAQKKAKDEKRGLWKDCGGGHVKNTPVPEATEVPEVGEKKLPGTVGTTLEADDRAVTLVDYFYSYDYGFGQPKGGYVFIVFYVRIENTASEGNNDYAEDDFKAFDAVTDAEFETTFVFSDVPLGYGDLSPGEFVEGQVVLEVQDTPNPTLIQFDPSTFGGGEVYWQVSR